MSNNGRLKVVPSIFNIVLKDGKVLLLRRSNTGWLDGWYDAPAGHLEDQEELKKGAVRELQEETGLTAKPQDLKLIHVYQNHHQPDEPHYGYMFLVTKWSGTPTIMEPHKCDHLDWFDLNNLPKKLPPYAKAALKNIKGSQVTISYHSPGSISQ